MPAPPAGGVDRDEDGVPAAGPAEAGDGAANELVTLGDRGVVGLGDGPILARPERRGGAERTAATLSGSIPPHAGRGLLTSAMTSASGGVEPVCRRRGGSSRRRRCRRPLCRPGSRHRTASPLVGHEPEHVVAEAELGPAVVAGLDRERRRRTVRSRAASRTRRSTCGRPGRTPDRTPGARPHAGRRGESSTRRGASSPSPAGTTAARCSSVNRAARLPVAIGSASGPCRSPSQPWSARRRLPRAIAAIARPSGDFDSELERAARRPGSHADPGQVGRGEVVADEVDASSGGRPGRAGSASVGSPVSGSATSSNRSRSPSAQDVAQVAPAQVDGRRAARQDAAASPQSWISIAV